MEWNLFMIFGTCFLFGQYGDVPLSTLDNPLLIAFSCWSGSCVPILGNFWPGEDLLPARRCATTPATGRRACGSSARTAAPRKKLDARIDKVARVAVEQLAKLYDREMAEYFSRRGWRSARCTATAAR